MFKKSILLEKFSLFTGVFFLQFIVFFPLDFSNNFQLTITDFIFGDFTQFVSEYVFGKKNIRIDYSSDSISMLILVIILLVNSAVFSFIIRKRRVQNFLSIIEYVCTIYIAVIFIKYGADKIFQAQFPKPEPNILFSRFGNLDQDILFWSIIGTSKIYNITIGSIEFFTGILLLFKRSQFLGLLLAIISFSQIFIINIGFDISVKFFSLILLLMSIFLVRESGWKLILKIICLPKKTYGDQLKFLPYQAFLKILIFGILLIKIGISYFNKEEQKNPLNLSGAYFITSKASPYQYLFFNKDQYLIFMEKSSEKMTAFHYDISVDHQIILEDYQHRVSKHRLVRNRANNTITFSFRNQIIHAKAIDFKQMNVLQERFHLLTDY